MLDNIKNQRDLSIEANLIVVFVYLGNSTNCIATLVIKIDMLIYNIISVFTLYMNKTLQYNKSDNIYEIKRQKDIFFRKLRKELHFSGC